MGAKKAQGFTQYTGRGSLHVKQEPNSSNGSKARPAQKEEQERYSPTYGIDDPFTAGPGNFPQFGMPFGDFGPFMD